MADHFDDASEARAEANARAERTGKDQYVYDELPDETGRVLYRVDDRNLLENCIYSVRGVDALYDALKEDDLTYEIRVSKELGRVIEAVASRLNMEPPGLILMLVESYQQENFPDIPPYQGKG